MRKRTIEKSKWILTRDRIWKAPSLRTTEAMEKICYLAAISGLSLVAAFVEVLIGRIIYGNYFRTLIIVERLACRADQGGILGDY